jgi:hypothetical protein
MPRKVSELFGALHFNNLFCLDLNADPICMVLETSYLFTDT